MDKMKEFTELKKLTRYNLPCLMETWQDVVINPDYWVQDFGGTTGAIALSVAEEPYHKVILSGVANADTARLYTVPKWQLAPGVWNTATFLKTLEMEWEAKFDTPGDILEANFIMGLTAGAAADRTSMNIAGFIFDGAGAINSLTDDAGTETVNTVGAPTVTNWNKYMIRAYRGAIEFWVNETMEARHITNLPDYNVHGMFYLPQEAAANGGELHIANVNIRPGVIVNG